MSLSTLTSAFRHHDIQLERALPGAERMLTACALIDASVAQAVTAAAGKGQIMACRKGCGTCCHQPIPLTPLEALLLVRYLQLHQPPALRATLARQWAASQAVPRLERPCPLLLDGCCTAHPVRPLACRRYVVLNRPCAPGEDATKSRPQDVLRPDRTQLDKALALTLPWYAAQPQAYTLPAQGDQAALRAFFAAVTTVIQALPWENLLAGRAETA